MPARASLERVRRESADAAVLEAPADQVLRVVLAFPAAPVVPAVPAQAAAGQLAIRLPAPDAGPSIHSRPRLRVKTLWNSYQP